MVVAGGVVEMGWYWWCVVERQWMDGWVAHHYAVLSAAAAGGGGMGFGGGVKEARVSGSAGAETWLDSLFFSSKLYREYASSWHVRLGEIQSTMWALTFG